MATDFFDQQEHARRQTGRLVALFVLAIAAIIAAIYTVATLVVIWSTKEGHPVVLDWERLGVIAGAALVIITAGSLFKIAMLRDGGEAVATMLGGRLVDPSRSSPTERRLLNVVEEMALASGMPVPPVYVLEKEPGINAFAAGHSSGDAVIAVSQGALDHLTRDELQGVIGHEFSHILNGDMRLNLRLIGLIAGILVISMIGQLVIRGVLEGTSRSSRSSSDDKGGGLALVVLIVLCGAALWVIGSLGVLFGRMIKCAVSRQREFLADASSVQFTRNPEGLAGALKKIGGLVAGSRIQSPHAEEACHMFFGQGVGSISQLFATHPPLVERIRRLDPSFDGAFAEVREGETVPDDEPAALGLASKSTPRPALVGDDSGIFKLNPAAAVATVGAPTSAHVDYASDLIDSLPPKLATAVGVPFSARAVVFALLLDPSEAVRRSQLAHLEATTAPGTVNEVLLLAPLIGGLGKPDRIPLVDLTFPALRRLSTEQYRSFRMSLDALVRADGRVILFEYALQRMLLRHLDRTFFRLPPPVMQFQTLDPLFRDCDLLISSLARLGHKEGSEVSRAYSVGMAKLQANQPGERVVSLLPAEACSLTGVDRALDCLAQGVPWIKRRILDACAACIACDGVVTLYEAELLRAIADSLDCPMPPLLAQRGDEEPAIAEMSARVADERTS